MHSKSDPHSKLASSLNVASRFMGTSHVYLGDCYSSRRRERMSQIKNNLSEGEDLGFGGNGEEDKHRKKS
jgi:hypothetical protein